VGPVHTVEQHRSAILCGLDGERRTVRARVFAGELRAIGGGGR
jgi:hypothetical protein